MQSRLSPSRKPPDAVEQVPYVNEKMPRIVVCQHRLCFRQNRDDPRLMPARYARAFLKGNRNDFRDVEAIAEAVQRPTIRFVATKTGEQLDLQALHRVRSRLISERRATVNEVRAFPFDPGVTVA
jgi:Transposase